MEKNKVQRDYHQGEDIKLSESITQSLLLEAQKSVAKVLIECIGSIVQTIGLILLFWIILYNCKAFQYSLTNKLFIFGEDIICNRYIIFYS